MKIELIFATHNVNKAKEIESLFSNKIQLKTLADIGCFEDIPEEQPSFAGNALQKARYIYDKFGVNCFADDSGLEINALNGEPGVYSARYAGKDKKDENNIRLVLEKLKDNSDRTAQFTTVIALLFEGKEYLFTGICKGEITTEKKGEKGFGYDPIFLPENKTQTFAEMSLDEKNKISHRSRAFAQLVAFFEKT